MGISIRRLRGGGSNGYIIEVSRGKFNEHRVSASPVAS